MCTRRTFRPCSPWLAPALFCYLALLATTGSVRADGACCLEGSPCDELSEAACTALAGTFMGDGTPCAPDPCWGACCTTGYPPTCLMSSSGDCGPIGAWFVGLGAWCAPDPCVVPGLGSCCGAGGSPGCEVMDALACESDGGVYTGDGLYCEPDPCIGACCLTTWPATCVMSKDADCGAPGSSFQGVGTSCAGGTCLEPGVGACCDPGGVPGCDVMMEHDCGDAGGLYLEDGIHCTPHPCPTPGHGACCRPDGGCLFLTEVDCTVIGGTYHGDLTTCADRPADCGNTLVLAKEGHDILLSWGPSSGASDYTMRRGRLRTLIDLQLDSSEIGRSGTVLWYTDTAQLHELPSPSYYRVCGVACWGLVGP